MESRAGEHCEGVEKWILLVKEIRDFNYHLVSKTLTGSAEPLVDLYTNCASSGVDESAYLQQWLTAIKQMEQAQYSTVSHGFRKYRGSRTPRGLLL